MKLSVGVCFLWCMAVGQVQAADDPRPCEQKECVAVVDVGSTGTRLHIYVYDRDAERNPAGIQELSSRKINPGFATLEAKSEIVDAYLDNLFSKVQEQHLPVYFYATAGMRLLPQPKQQALYDLASAWFAKQSRWQLKEAKTITGTQEGVFGWLGANYQLNTLDPRHNKPLIGVLDMGGASVQISFPVQDVQGIAAEDLVSLDVYGRRISLFVHSFLGLGQTLLSEQFLDADSCFISNYTLPSGALAKGDAPACQSKIDALINSVHQVNQKIQPLLPSNTAHDWYVMGGLEALAREKDGPFSFNKEYITAEDLLQQGNSKACTQNWQSLYSRYTKNSFLHAYCLLPAYYYALMIDGYGLSPQQPIKLSSTDWTMGVVVQQPRTSTSASHQ